MNRPAPTLAVSGRNLALGIALFAAAAIAGCQTPAAPFDPFLAGRSTIPPPGTAVPAAASPYYNTAPPTVTVPAPGAVYTAPGAIPVAAPTISVPPAGAGQLPRGISVPQSNKSARGDGSQLATWQKSDNLQTSSAPGAALSNAKSSDTGDDTDSASTFELATTNSHAIRPRQETGVVQASHEEPGREVPIRIVEPATKTTAAATPGEKSTARAASDANKSSSRGKSVPSRRLPELTDFPAAAGGIERTAKQLP